jgi:hypothetical protein
VQLAQAHGVAGLRAQLAQALIVPLAQQAVLSLAEQVQPEQLAQSTRERAAWGPELAGAALHPVMRPLAPETIYARTMRTERSARLRQWRNRGRHSVCDRRGS